MTTNIPRTPSAAPASTSGPRSTPPAPPSVAEDRFSREPQALGEPLAQRTSGDSYQSVRAASPSAALQYLRAEFDRALKGRKVTSGAKDVNAFELNSYIAHTDSSNEKMATGKEEALKEAISSQVIRTGKKLQPGDVLAISLDLNGGNMAKALLTVHNTLRALSRGDDAATGIWDQDLNFFHQFLDTRFRTEPTTPQTDLSDDWYHMFGMATLGFVSQQKGFWDLRRDALAAEGTSVWAAAPLWAGNVLNAMANLPGGMDALTDWIAKKYGLAKTDGAALFDALGEQVIFGVLMNGMEHGWSDAFSGALDRIKPGGKGITEDWGEVLDQLSHGWRKGAASYEPDEFKAELYGADLGRHLGDRF